MTDPVHEELEQKPDSVTYYSDSKVVLGYISNESRRFYVYVSNRVERIRRSSAPHQWKYVATNLNPADLATRSIEASKLKESTWHKGSKGPVCQPVRCTLKSLSLWILRALLMHSAGS